MTFVGKILVIVIMAFSLIFLGISTVVFTTTKDWRDATEKQKEKVRDLTKKLNDAQAAVEAANKDLDSAKAGYEALSKNLNNQIQAQAGRTQRSDPGARAHPRNGHQAQHGPARARGQVLRPAPAERPVRRHQPDQGAREPAPGRWRGQAG